MKILTQRDANVPENPQTGEEGYCLGRVFVDNVYFAESLEDQDRYLEKGQNSKVYARTAIPRGTYEIQITMSSRFKKPMIQFMNVPSFVGVRAHGANKAKQLQGCTALGRVRTQDGVADCKETVEKLFNRVREALARKEQVTWTIE